MSPSTMLNIALFSAAILLGCGSVAGQAAEGQPIRFTTDTTQTSLPIWWAQENGIFEKHGLKYIDTLVNAGVLGLQSIGAGQNDASIQSDPPTCTNIANGIDAVIVGVIAKGQESMALVARKSYGSINELVGKKIAWMGGSGGELGFFKYLAARGLEPGRFDHVNLPPAEAVPTLINGAADAIWFWEPWARKAVALAPNDVGIIDRSSRDDYDLNMILTVRRDFAQSHPETVQTFLKVLLEAEAALKQFPEKAAELYARRLRTSLEDAQLALGDYPIHLDLNGEFVTELTGICDLLARLGRVKQAPDWRGIVDPSFLRAVAPDRVADMPQ